MRILTKAVVLMVMVAIGLLFSPGSVDRADTSAMVTATAATPPSGVGHAVPEPAADLDGDETPNCATHNEYDRIDLFQSPGEVEGIVGNDGWFIDTTHPDTFARGYRSCWAPGERFVKVWFEQDNRLVFDKAVLDV